MIVHCSSQILFYSNLCKSFNTSIHTSNVSSKFYVMFYDVSLSTLILKTSKGSSDRKLSFCGLGNFIHCIQMLCVETNKTESKPNQGINYQRLLLRNIWKKKKREKETLLSNNLTKIHPIYANLLQWHALNHWIHNDYNLNTKKTYTYSCTTYITIINFNFVELTIRLKFFMNFVCFLRTSRTAQSNDYFFSSSLYLIPNGVHKPIIIYIIYKTTYNPKPCISNTQVYINHTQLHISHSPLWIVKDKNWI